MPKQDRLLLIFIRNPELGKCKTRLASSIGPVKALEIYHFLLQHTHQITLECAAHRWVMYSEYIAENDLWDEGAFSKKLQQGTHLGDRMLNAFEKGFEAGFKNIIVIGSDLYDLTSEELNEAFEKLENNDAVIGPAADGGYYLLGLSHLIPEVFDPKEWGTETVFQDTMKTLKKYNNGILPEKNDVDVLEDIKDIPTFQRFLN